MHPVVSCHMLAQYQHLQILFGPTPSPAFRDVNDNIKYHLDVEKDQKVTKIRDGITQNVLMVMCFNVLSFVDL